MLNPKTITDAIVTQLQAIRPLATAMTVSGVIRINAYHYRLGTEQRLAEAIFKMPAPSMLVTWEGTQGGRFSGYSIWKHQFGIYFRMGNAAGQSNPVGYEDLWWTTCNVAPQGSPVNIRYMNLLPNLDIMDTPTIQHQLDEELIDRFKGVFVIPEIGDN